MTLHQWKIFNQQQTGEGFKGVGEVGGQAPVTAIIISLSLVPPENPNLEEAASSRSSGASVILGPQAAVKRKTHTSSPKLWTWAVEIKEGEVRAWGWRLQICSPNRRRRRKRSNPPQGRLAVRPATSRYTLFKSTGGRTQTLQTWCTCWFSAYNYFYEMYYLGLTHTLLCRLLLLHHCLTARPLTHLPLALSASYVTAFFPHIAIIPTHSCLSVCHISNTQPEKNSRALQQSISADLEHIYIPVMDFPMQSTQQMNRERQNSF